MVQVNVILGAGSIGQAIARRVSAGRHVVVSDLRLEAAQAAAETLADAGFDVSATAVDVSSRESVHNLVATATAAGDVMGVIHAAGVSPSQAPPATILSVDLYGTALVLEEFGAVIAPGGSGVVIASQSGHRLPALSLVQDAALATTPVRSTPTRSQSAATSCGSKPRPCGGASGVRASTRSVPASSSRRWRVKNSPVPVAGAIAGCWSCALLGGRVRPTRSAPLASC